MNTKILGSLLLLSGLMGCSSPSAIDQVQSNQSANSQLLQQQAMRMEMQEEYLAQLAESQLEIAIALQRLEGQLTQLRPSVPDQAQRQPSAQRPSAPSARPQAQAETLKVAPVVENKQVVGRNEWVWLDLLSRNLKARVDTGALSSSLSAVELLPFERDGKDWIRFRVPDEEHPDGGDLYEAPLIKYVRIRQSAAEKLERRPVIRLKVRLGELVDDVEFNLTNREDMLYPVLLGRNFLRDVALVDVAKRFTQPKHRPDSASAKK